MSEGLEGVSLLSFLFFVFIFVRNRAQRSTSDLFP